MTSSNSGRKSEEKRKIAVGRREDRETCFCGKLGCSETEKIKEFRREGGHRNMHKKTKL